MSKSSFKKKVKNDKLKFAVITIVFVVLSMALIGLFVKLDRQTSFTTIGGESYSIGTLDEKGEFAESDLSIYLRKDITVDGLKCQLKKDSNISYKLFFYDEEGEFLGVSGDLVEDYESDEETPVGASSVRIVITPIEDEDGKVSLVEVLGYANQLTVTVNK
ncbi:MAG: hypothetical protein J6Q32_03185 [Clostridia bacterium]|nr:hypothetical protein [Clostridia bacterium]